MSTTKSGVRYWVGVIHLWIGMSSGLVVFILALTGCLYAFQSEIQDLTQPYRFVQQPSAQQKAPSILRAVALKQLPGKKLHAILYGPSGRAAQAIFYQFDPEYYYIVYLNPYSGEVLKVKDMNADFFRFILNGHYYLWLPPNIGQPIVASATLVFFIMLITGIILWWPIKKGSARQRFKIKWNARWRRKNYDLHNVLGFYSSWIAIILTLTGLVFGFQWFARSVYKVAGGSKSIEYREPESQIVNHFSNDSLKIDSGWKQIQRQYQGFETIEVHIPETITSPLAINVNPDAKTYWQISYHYLDQQSLKPLSVNHIYGDYKDATAADKLLRMNYDIHTGAILGLPGKCLAFIASLIVASLPITGFCIWWGRRNK